MLSDVVAEQVFKLRKAAGLTQEQLAKRCGDFGWPSLTYGVIGSIETGRPREKGGPRTREVTVDELVGLALALDVPPVSLVAPLDHQHLDLAPALTVDPWSALLWLIGRHRADELPGSSSERWERFSQQIRKGLEIMDIVEEIAPLGIVYAGARSADPTARAQAVEQAEAHDRSMLALLALRLSEFRKWRDGVPPPSLPARVVARADELGVDLVGAKS